MTFVVVVVHTQESMVEAVVDTSDGMRRRIELKWADNTGRKGLPVGWAEQIKTEAAYQQSNKDVFQGLFGGGLR